jgi:hypothetical protein
MTPIAHQPLAKHLKFPELCSQIRSLGVGLAAEKCRAMMLDSIR